MNRHPILFVSHGAPDVLLKPGATVRLWETLGDRLPRPRAVEPAVTRVATLPSASQARALGPAPENRRVAFVNAGLKGKAIGVADLASPGKNFFSIVFRGKPATKGYTDVR